MLTPTPGRAAAPRTPLMDLPDEQRHFWEEQLRVTCRLLCALIHYYKHDKRKTQLKAAWRRKPKSAKGQNGANAVATPACSKLEKLTEGMGALTEATAEMKTALTMMHVKRFVNR